MSGADDLENRNLELKNEKLDLEIKRLRKPWVNPAVLVSVAAIIIAGGGWVLDLVFSSLTHKMEVHQLQQVKGSLDKDIQLLKEDAEKKQKDLANVNEQWKQVKKDLAEAEKARKKAESAMRIAAKLLASPEGVVKSLRENVQEAMLSALTSAPGGSMEAGVLGKRVAASFPGLERTLAEEIVHAIAMSALSTAVELAPEMSLEAHHDGANLMVRLSQ